MKRISVIGLLFVMVFAIWAWSGVRPYERKVSKTVAGVADENGDNTFNDTLMGIIPTGHFRNKVFGRVIFDSTLYDTGLFGGADTVIMMLKAYYGSGDLSRYVTIDSMRKVFAAGANVNCTLNINESIDSLFLERLDLIVHFADTVDTGIVLADSAKFSYRYKIWHGYED